MVGTQVIIHNISPDEIAEMMRSIVHAEVKSQLAPLLPLEGKAALLPEYPSRKQTRDFLGVTYATLNNWSKDTEDRRAILVPLHIGSRVRYRREDVLATLKEARRFKSSDTGANKIE